MNKLLIFTEYFLPAKKGGGPVSSIRNLIDLLHEELEIRVVCFNHDMNSTEPLTGIKSDEWNNWENKAQVYYTSKQSLSKSGITKIVNDFTPNTIYLNAIFVYQFVVFPIWASKKINSKVVIASRGMLQIEALNQKKIKKKVYTNLLKYSGILSNITWHSTNTSETLDVKRVFGSNRIEMISNIPIVPNKKIQFYNLEELNLISISLNTEMKNIHFLLNVLSKVSREVNYDIYGPIKDVEYWKKCKDLIKTMPSNISVNYKGEIDPDKVTETISKYNLFTLPTLGENFGHAIFESFACGVPVLISNKTPWRELESKNIGFDLELDTNTWIKTIESLDVESLSSIRDNSLNFAKNYFDNGNFKQLYKNLFE